MPKLPGIKALTCKIQAYIDECRSADTKKPVFANIAGFCRWAGIPLADLMAMRRKRPEDFDAIAAYFEDAALNSGVTASLIGMYLRQYGFWQADTEDEFICDHDMIADGV